MGHSVGFKIKGKESIGSVPGGFCSIIVATVVFAYAVLVYSTVLFQLAFATEVKPDYVNWKESVGVNEKEPTTFETANGATYGIQIFDYAGNLDATALNDYLRISYYYVDNNNMLVAPADFEEDHDEEDDDNDEEEELEKKAES